MIVPDRPRNQFAVELFGTEEPRLMGLDKLFLNNAVKPFRVRRPIRLAVKTSAPYGCYLS
jgi:hypothetical protein